MNLAELSEIIIVSSLIGVIIAFFALFIGGTNMPEESTKYLPNAGEYSDCKKVAIGFAENEDTGTPYIYSEWKHEDLMYSVTVFTYLSDASFEKALEKLESIGFNNDFKNPACEAEYTDLICRHETWQGKVRAKFEFANWGSGGGGLTHKEASINSIRLMNEKFKKAKGGSTRKASSPPPAKKKAATTPPPPAGQTHREAAWQAWAEPRGDWEAAALTDGWDVLCTKTISDKDEIKFTAEDWAAVKEAAESAPF